MVNELKSQIMTMCEMTRERSKGEPEKVCKRTKHEHRW